MGDKSCVKGGLRVELNVRIAWVQVEVTRVLSPQMVGCVYLRVVYSRALLAGRSSHVLFLPY